MLKEIRNSFSNTKKKATRLIVNEHLIKQTEKNNQMKEHIEQNYQSNSSNNANQNFTFKCKSLKNSTNALNKTKSNTFHNYDSAEEYVHNKDDKTLDTTLQNKLVRNSSHGTFSINKMNISSRSGFKQHKENPKVKRKLLQDYLLSISKDFWQKNLQQQKEDFYKNYENNRWIQQIKSDGFEENNRELNTKKNILRDLEEKVFRAKEKLTFTKKGTADHEVRLVRWKIRIDQESEIIEKSKAERALMHKEIMELKKENQLFPSQTEQTKEETSILNERVILEKNSISKLGIEIQQLNTKMSNLTKDKENLLTSLKVLKKQIESYRLKITNTYQKSATFMIEVNNLVNDPELFSK